MRRLVALAIGAVALTAIVAVATTARSRDPRPTTRNPEFEVKVTPEMIRHSHIEYALYFADFAWSIGVLLVILAAGLSRRMREWAARVGRWKFVAAMLFFVLFSFASEVLEFPLTFYGGYVVPHQFDLTNQSFAAWMGDLGKGFAINIVIGSVLSALALLIIRKVRRWWIPLWLGSIPLMVLLVIIAPVLLDPVFNKFIPLQNQQLKHDLLEEASRAGIEGGRVYQVDKSKQTKTMNAYVSGLGPTKRIVLWDTLLAKMNHDEILAVMGHEMGHYVLHHVWKGLAFGVVISLIVCFLGQQFYERGLGRWGIEERGDPASLPWLLIIVTIVGFLLSPVINGVSRRFEHQADIFGLELTHLNAPMATAFVKLAEDSKQEPRPNPFIEFWMFSHPSLGRRIDFVLSSKPWEKGQQ